MRAERNLDNGFLSKLSALARRALEHHGISMLQQLSTFSEKEILQFHGIGPASLPILRASLKESGLLFTQEEGSFHLLKRRIQFGWSHFSH